MKTKNKIFKHQLKDIKQVDKNSRLNLAQRLKSARRVEILDGWETRRGLLKYQDL